MTLTTNKNLVMEAEKIFLGDPNLHMEGEVNQKMQPMVLGSMLVQMMSELLAIVKNSQFICQGVPAPLADETGGTGKVAKKIGDLEKKLNTILSDNHFIEPNKGSKEWVPTQQ